MRAGRQNLPSSNSFVNIFNEYKYHMLVSFPVIYFMVYRARIVKYVVRMREQKDFLTWMKRGAGELFSMGGEIDRGLVDGW